MEELEWNIYIVHNVDRDEGKWISELHYYHCSNVHIHITCRTFISLSSSVCDTRTHKSTHMWSCMLSIAWVCGWQRKRSLMFVQQIRKWISKPKSYVYILIIHKPIQCWFINHQTSSLTHTLISKKHTSNYLQYHPPD